ncbi:MAG: hypothetical protein ACLRWQ_21465 [Flavonifractor plautii]
MGLLAPGLADLRPPADPGGGGGGGPVYAVVPASGDGGPPGTGREGASLAAGGELARFTIVVADGGLDGMGAGGGRGSCWPGRPGIVLCPAERLGEYIKA